MSDLISRDALKKQVKELLDLAVKRVDDTPNNSPCYRMYVAQENERARLIDLIDSAPVVARTERPFVCIEGKVIYITQGHIDALLKYERDERLKEYVNEFMKSLDQASEMGDGGADNG